MEFTKSEFIMCHKPNLHIIKGNYTIDHNYRAELRKIDDEYTEFIFGTTTNLDDFYVCVLRCKLYTCVKEKILYIIDLYGFADNLYDPNEIYRLNSVENYWRVSQENLDLFNLSLQRMYPDWEIIKYTFDSMHVFNLTKKIFNNVLYYPNYLLKYLNSDIIDKIHDLNAEKIFNIDDIKWKYDDEETNKLWIKCVNSGSDYGIIATWFDIDKNYKVFKE